jgi:hypothetical protein
MREIVERGMKELLKSVASIAESIPLQKKVNLEEEIIEKKEKKKF